ncbi:MAG TPA: tautomerase family protein [Thermoanaerobaculia bacterium]|jgi:phenylpyruvate tautomerase PptA (4-oxalocrotonate tautomerase family)
MPLVRVTLRKGKSSEFIRAAGEAIHDALVATANVPADDRFQVFDEVESDRLFAHPSYGGVERSENLIIVEITLNAGRTVEIKKALYAEIVVRLGRAVDVRPDDVLISLVEVTKENWSFGKGLATYAS